ncbi:MAG: class I SAM-dependent RNA methyltransferase [Sneathiella sp.]|nr:class I SAM-dependent RNA methyltransferase [Sneathiella sp.]
MNPEITIEQLGSGGDGIGQLDGAPIYVPYSAIGDQVRVRTTDNRGAGVLGEIEEILTPSADRQEVKCRHFGTCGGCSLQHLQDEYVADWKADLIRQALAQKDITDVQILPTVMSPELSRRRVEFVAKKRKKGVMIGYHRPRSHQIFDVGECPLVLPELLNLVKPLRVILPDLMPRNSEARLTLTATNNGVDLLVSIAAPIDLAGREQLAQFAQQHKLCRISWYDEAEKLMDQVASIKPAAITVRDKDTLLPAGGFLQATLDGQETLVRLALENLPKKSRIVDLFAGCGTFTLPAAQGSKGVHAVEGSRTHTDNMQEAANQQMLAVTTEARDLFRRPLLAEEFKNFDVAIIDPPRAGARAQVQELGLSNIKTVIFISCNPKSFARDAEMLLDYGFKMGPITPVDQFRWSTHVELFTTFTR